MARDIVLGIETTGPDTANGHRVIEIACVELHDLMPTGRSFHRYIDPEREVDPDAQRAHGISNAFLAGKPCFAEEEVASEFLAFIEGASLVVHDTAFERNFIDHELRRAGVPSPRPDRWIDVMALARKRFPRMNNSLDALRDRYNIPASIEEGRSALTDARTLADVYRELVISNRVAAPPFIPDTNPAAIDFTLLKGRIAVSNEPVSSDAEPNTILAMIALVRLSLSELLTDFAGGTNASPRLVARLNRLRCNLPYALPDLETVLRLGHEADVLRAFLANLCPGELDAEQRAAIEVLAMRLEECAAQYGQWRVLKRNARAADLTAEQGKIAKQAAVVLIAEMESAEGQQSVDPSGLHPIGETAKSGTVCLR
jgi:DNA polymerase-3 subunit epsilon